MLAAGIPPVQLPQPTKRRAACDECRTKKLKCTGEQPSCSRCVREGITCVYSAQKQMGRPKKRQRTGEEGGEAAATVNDTSDVNAAGQQAWNSSNGTSLGLDHGGQDSTFEDYLTPGGSLQPWLQSAEWSIPAENNIPGLMPDSASNSPPTINLPPELQATGGAHAYHHNHNHSSANNSSANLLLDPSLAATGLDLGVCSPALPSCACLSTMYLTLNTLQGMDTSFPFPFALHPLREAMQTASEVLNCEQCPTKFLSAIQNTQLVGTLLMSIAERFSKVLESISAESDRAELAGETKKFRLADLNTSTSHLHTGGLGCAASFTIDLSAQEWRSMTKKVVRAEVHGPSEGNTCCPYMVGLIEHMESRQEKWHRVDHHLPADFPRDPETGEPMGGRHIPKADHVCLKLCEYSRKLVEGYDWS